MERRVKEEDSTRDSKHNNDNIIDHIRALAAKNARAPLNTEESLLLFLQSWWSRLYNRPLKDPLLQSYSLAELLYEFYDRIERNKAEEEKIDAQDVKIEEEKEQEALDWAEEEERRELEQEMKAQAAKSASKDPTKDPDNIAWMEEQINKSKEIYGDSFGEDIEEVFEE